MNKKPKYMISRNMMGRSLWIAVMMLLFAGGCSPINDDLDDCFALASLRMVYTNNVAGEDRFSDQVETIDFYVYNRSDSTLFMTKSFTKAEMAAEKYNLKLDWLKRGNYYIVAFGNNHEDHYEIQSHEHLDPLRVKMLCRDGSGTVYNNPCHFFHGTTSITWNETGAKTVAMTKSTNNINIHVLNRTTVTRAFVEGFPDFEVSVTAQNGTIKNDNTLDGSDTRTMTHIAHDEFTLDQQEFHTTLTVGRLFQNDGSQVVIKQRDSSTETGAVYYSQNLTDRILDEDRWTGNADDYLHKQDEYDLYYTVDVKYGIVVVAEVTMEDWNTITNPNQGL